ncbi:hypothetical protein C362_03985 [Cryptococcus neoformans Bt1]|nr:hypothetical protein C362_03985 [Cryptococcus neoformans var. grubii Bt1]
MRLSTTLPLILFPTLTLAHVDRIHPAHRRHLARSGSGGYGKRAPALLDDLSGLFDGDSGNTSSAASSTSTTSSAAASSSSSQSSVAHSSTAVTTTSRDEATTTSMASSLPSTSSASPTSIATTSTEVSSSTADPSVNATSSEVSSSDSTSTTSSSSTEHSLSPSVTSTTSSVAADSTVPLSTSASVQYTTNAAGQTQLVTVILTQSADDATRSADAATASSTSTAAAQKEGSKFPTGAIIGICVGVGTAILALIALAVWRMKRRSGDEDEAIRWPELNRHGDSDAHHALPARETGQHGFETNPLERSLSSSSELQYADYPVASHPDYDLPQHSPMPMALNGSSFGASSSLEDDYALSEKYPPPSPHPPSHDEHDNYTSLPPPVQSQASVGLGMGGAIFGHATTPEEEDPYGGVQMTQLGQGVTYQGMTSPEYGHQPMPNPHDYR